MKRLMIFPALAMLAIGLAGCNSCGGGRWFGNRNECCDPCAGVGFDGVSDSGCCGAGGVMGDGYAPAIQSVPGTTYVPGPT
jgi:hypothetical protein